MGYHVSSDRMENIINELKKEYRIYAPKRFPKRGRDSKSDLIRYAEINSLAEIVHNVKSDFSPKEVFHPIIQTMLYFNGDTCTESDLSDNRDLLVFLRPCDINGIRRLDTVFLKNGGRGDNYYMRLREKLKLVMIECTEGWDTCFCVSAESNRSEEYSLAVRFGEQGLLVEVRDEDFSKYFTEESQQDFSPEFISENSKKVIFPEINDQEKLKKAFSLGLWEETGLKCISCGGCNTVCITCSCFDTTDVIYNEASRDGERRRIWSSCMLEDFTVMAGGHNVRKSAGDRLRFKTLHKVYDYRKRFGGENMCVGCGRCDSRCPGNISFSDTINSLRRLMKDE
ncbi:MAG: anaerobic sulfite reductase subunit AsrA [Clostridiales bacterium]|nr:anaerobic sulfite reductase subunit AsrA [Clostridiales bacterium]